MRNPTRLWTFFVSLTLSATFVASAAVVGCGGGSSHGSGFVAPPSGTTPTGGTDASVPEPQPTASPTPGDPAPATSAVATADLALTEFTLPASVQPGERMRIDWTVVSRLPLKETRYHYGTTPTALTTEGPAYDFGAGTFSNTDSVLVMERSGSVFIAITAVDVEGHRLDSAPKEVPVRWATPADALIVTATPRVPIPDTGRTIETQIAVSPSGAIDELQVRMDLQHPRRGDLEVDLVAPSGTVVRLHAPDDNVKPDLLGTFGNDMVSWDPLTTLRGQPFQGVWKIRMTDRVAGNGPGTLGMVGLVIRRKQDAITREAVFPDIILRPPGNMSIVRAVNDGNKKVLHFASTLANAGPAPLIMRGEVDHVTGRTRAFQVIVERLRDAQGRFLGFEEVREVLIGDFVFDGHQDHDHWHVADIGRYTLMNLDFTPNPNVQQTAKLARCFTDSQRFSTTLEGAPPERVYLCGQAKQGISIGWEDTYAAGTNGQEMNISNLPDGSYYLVTEFMRRLEESGDDVNNDSAVKIAIQGDTLTVLESIDGARLKELRAAAASSASASGP